MQFYNHFTVTKAKLKCTFVNGGSSATQSNSICGIEVSGNPTPTTAINDLYEQGRTNLRVCMHQEHKPVIMSKTLDMSKFLNQDVLQEDANAGSATSTPSEIVFFHISVMQMNAAVNQSGAMNVFFELVQDAVFHEPKPLAGS